MARARLAAAPTPASTPPQLQFFQQLLVVFGAVLSTADTATNIVILVFLWEDREPVWFGLLCTCVVAGAVLAAAHAAASGSTATVSLTMDEKTDEYIGGRLFQAVLEAGPAAMLQLYIILVQEDYDAMRITSVVLSVCAVASTLAMDTAPADSSKAEVACVFVFCLCEVVSTVVCVSLFAVLFKGWVFVAAMLHLILIFSTWRWWSTSMRGRRCDLCGMGMFAAVLNFVATIHTGEDASYVYQWWKYDATQPHFLRGGAPIGAFLGLTVVQDIARVGYISAVLVKGSDNDNHPVLAAGMGGAFVVQHLALLSYWLLWRRSHAAKARRVRTRSSRSLSGGSASGVGVKRKGSGASNGSPLPSESTEGGTDIINPVHRYSFGQRQGLAVSVASW